MNTLSSMNIINSYVSYELTRVGFASWSYIDMDSNNYCKENMLYEYDIP